jgi:hypothetical protein
MNRSLVIIILALLCFSCTKPNKISTVEDSLIWPLKMGNYWHYQGVASYKDGGSRDTTDFTILIDSSKYFKGEEYVAADSFYDWWYRSAKTEVWQSNADGTDVSIIARNLNGEQAEIHKQSGTFHYFIGGEEFTGTLTRTAKSQIVVIGSYNCSNTTEEVYTNEAGEVVQKKVVHYANNKGPVCFKYYTNHTTPGSSDIYLTLQYTLDSLYIQE